MKKKLRFILLTVLCLCLIGGVTGCAALDDAINEIKGNLVGNGYTIRTYDNYGSKVMTTTGDKINIQGNPVKTTSYSSDGSVVTGYEMSSVITINIDGKEIQSCGDTCIFEQNGLQPDVDFVQTDIYSQSTGKLSRTDSKRSSHYIERQAIFDGFLNYGYCFLFGGWFIHYLRSIER